MNRIDRLTAILIHLQSKKIVRAEEIADRFEISLRTVYRDVKALMEAGVPIGSEAGTGYFIVDGYHLPPVMFSREEASAIVLAGKLVEKMTDESVRRSYESALIKIKAVLSESEKDHLEGMDSYVEVYQPSTPEAPQLPNHFLTAIQQGLANKTVLALQYFSGKDEITDRNVEPIGILYYNAAWHLIGWCRTRNAYRDFRADRIRELTATTVRFDNRNLLSLQDYLQTFMQCHEGMTRVTVIFDKSLLKYKKYTYGFVSEEDLGDRIRMTFLVESLKRLGYWLLTLGRSVEIESPVELRTIMATLVEELFEHHVEGIKR